MPKRVFVRMPAYKHPLFLAVTNLDDLMSQLEAIVGEEDGEVTDLTYNEVCLSSHLLIEASALHPPKKTLQYSWIWLIWLV